MFRAKSPKNDGHVWPVGLSQSVLQQSERLVDSRMQWDFLIFFFLYIAASHTVHTSVFLCIAIVSCHIYIFLQHVTFDIFLTKNAENVGECSKAQWMCVDQTIALHKNYRLLLILLRATISKEAMAWVHWCRERLAAVQWRKRQST